MRKALIISFAIIHLLGNTEFGQILRWPELFSHFFQHSQLNPEINFFEFIAVHYAGDDGTDADNDIDSKLPCRDLNHSSITVAFSPMVRPLIIENPLAANTVKKLSCCIFSIPSGFEYSILQPPRA
ncbi:MAG TPA: hypothetical protein PKA77_06170 [Chitinophagaceae bacterium]|jgi:hypothetical protein|nr:hypothetical protein [Chitinophagaceae bacterium]HMU57425.1 hypothetical protein [Chitinophagaceae bacterium]